MEACNEKREGDRMTSEHPRSPARWSSTPPRSKSSRYDLFLATPMAAFATAGEYQDSRKLILGLIDHLRECFANLNSVYYAGTAIGGGPEFTQPQDALEADLAAVGSSRCLLLVYPAKLATGALVEIGYAMALRIPVAVVVREHVDLPYFLRHVEGRVDPNVSGPLAVVRYSTDKRLLNQCVRGLRLLGVS